MTEGPEFRVSKPIMSATKALVATGTTLLGFLALLGVDIGDGSVGSGEAGGLVTAGITAVVTVIGVWTARNKEL